MVWKGGRTEGAVVYFYGGLGKCRRVGGPLEEVHAPCHANGMEKVGSCYHTPHPSLLPIATAPAALTKSRAWKYLIVPPSHGTLVMPPPSTPPQKQSWVNATNVITRSLTPWRDPAQPNFMRIRRWYANPSGGTERSGGGNCYLFRIGAPQTLRQGLE